MFLWKSRVQFRTLRSLLLISLSLALSACGGGSTSADGAANATTVVTATAPLSGTYLVSWNPVADSRVTGYKLYYSTTPLSNGTPETVLVGDATSYAFDPAAAGISGGTTVHFAVAAIGSDAESPMSTPVSVVVQ